MFIDAVFAPIKNNLDRTISTLYKQWSVSVDIMPTGLIGSHGNIFHIGLGPDMVSYGDRIPAIWFLPDTTQLHITSAVNGQPNYRPSDTDPIPMNEWTRVEVSQLRLTDGSYQHTIRVGDTIYDQILNTDPREFKNIKVYTSDNHYLAADALLTNFKIDTFPDDYVYNCEFIHFPTLNDQTFV